MANVLQEILRVIPIYQTFLENQAANCNGLFQSLQSEKTTLNEQLVTLNQKYDKIENELTRFGLLYNDITKDMDDITKFKENMPNNRFVRF
jgi:predicted  nucleic acid-binding Zn-ribbon protein